MATHSYAEVEKMKVRAWKNKAKGKGIRWRMLRDLISTISSQWLTSYQIETSMIRLWGTKRGRTREMLSELVGMGDIKTDKSLKPPFDMMYYMNQDRVNFWLGIAGLKGIPAGIVEAVSISKNARPSEG